MGYYINPTNETKEAWLSAFPEVDPQETGFIDGGDRLVCLVDNRAFTAAAVMVNADEYAEFMRDDGRKKIWYRVPAVSLIMNEWLKAVV